MSKHHFHMTQKQYDEYMQKFNDHPANTTSYMEPPFGGKSVGEKKDPRFNTPVCITIYSLRKRLADTDGISGKAAIDGLVKGGILADDSPLCVKEVKYRQEYSKEEMTIIKVEEAE